MQLNQEDLYETEVDENGMMWTILKTTIPLMEPGFEVRPFSYSVPSLEKIMTFQPYDYGYALCMEPRPQVAPWPSVIPGAYTPQVRLGAQASIDFRWGYITMCFAARNDAATGA